MSSISRCRTSWSLSQVILLFTSILLAFIFVDSSSDVAHKPCGQDVTSYLVAKILQLRGVEKSEIRLERDSLNKLLPLIEEEVGGGNFSALRACIDDDDNVDVANLTVCLKRACIGASFEEDDHAYVIYSLLVESLGKRCYFLNGDTEVGEERGKVPWQKSVGYGTGFAAIVVAGSQFGGFLYPFRKHIVYKVVLTYLIGLACGTLAGGGVLHLMPASLDMQTRQPDHAYIYRAAMILGGAYLFYWVERILRDVSKWNKSRKTRDRLSKRREVVNESNKKLLLKNANNEPIAEEETRGGGGGGGGGGGTVVVADGKASRKVSIDNIIGNPAMATAENGKAGVLSSEELRKDLLESNHRNNNEEKTVMVEKKRERLPSHSSRSQIEEDALPQKAGEVAPIAWILIMAKIFSTFIDGLSMGAAFTDTIPMGIKIGIAIICEEYPHELGDIAVLLNSGMNFKRALLWNFIAASAVFPGVYVGIVAGGTSDANPWIFAIAAGMFVYIALVDMIPELNKLGEELSQAGVHYVIVTVIQHLGLFSGFMLMFCMAVWGDDIGE